MENNRPINQEKTASTLEKRYDQSYCSKLNGTRDDYTEGSSLTYYGI